MSVIVIVLAIVLISAAYLQDSKKRNEHRDCGSAGGNEEDAKHTYVDHNDDLYADDLLERQREAEERDRL